VAAFPNCALLTENCELVNELTNVSPLELQRRRIESAEANPGTGSGTPVISADGVVGAAIIAGAVFGGISGAFFIRSRSGKYAAMGRG